MQSQPRDRESWLALARQVEAAGFRSLLVADHPGSGASPFVALAAAAGVTETLRLGSYVVQAGVREPMHIAVDAATLARLAPGRVILGLGAGHTPAEWRQVGRERPSPAERAQRLVEVVDVIDRLLRGETVSHDTALLTLRDAHLDEPDGVRDHICLLIGGGNAAILRAAARQADIVALSGLGRTLPDGHRHEVRWSRPELERQLGIVGEAAAAAGRDPVLDALVQVVELTDDRCGALERLAEEIATPVDDLAETPFLLIGTVEQMAAQLQRQAADFGITSYVVREPAVEIMGAVMQGLAA